MIDPISKALAKGQNFYQYAREIGLVEKEHPQMWVATQLAFEAKEEDFKRPRQKGEFVVLDFSESALYDRRKFNLFLTVQEASEFGCKNPKLGRRNFVIKSWTQYRQTSDYRRCSEIQSNLLKWQQTKYQKKNGLDKSGKPLKPQKLLRPAMLSVEERKARFREKCERLLNSRREKRYQKNSQMKHGSLRKNLKM